MARDSVGDHHGTLGGATWTEAGKYGAALQFDGEDDLLTITDDDALDFTDSFTLEAWVRPDSNSTWGPIFTKESEVFMSYQLYSSDEAGGEPVGWVAENDWVTYKAVAGEEALPLASWSHLALTSDGEDLRLYIDGKLEATASSVMAQKTEGPLQIGGNFVFNEYFDGRVDEVRLYNEVLGAEAIGEDMEVEIGVAPKPQPIAAFSFDEGEGELAQDSAGDHDGTLGGATWTEAGKYGAALQFDGEDDLLTITDDDALDFTDSFTFEAWVRPDTAPTWATIMGKVEWPEESQPLGYLFYAQSEEEHTPMGYTADGSSFKLIAGPEEPPLETWTHLALTSDGGQMRLYVEGELVKTGPALPVAATKGELTIGGNDVWGEYLDGRIDEIRTYDGILDAEEIGEDMAVRVAPPPTLDGKPSIRGTAKETVPLRAEPGGWDGWRPISYAYQWKRCNSSGESCVNIESASQRVYTPTSADLGKRLRVQVTATNSSGSGESLSNATSVVAESAPLFQKEPEIEGTLKQGSIVEVSLQALKGTKPLEVGFEWLRCRDQCTPIESVTESSYQLKAADVGHYIRVNVTAVNGLGEADSETPAAGPVESSETGGAPVVQAFPKLTGPPGVDATIGATLGEWVGAGEITETIQWQRCNGTVESCETISGATQQLYVPTPADEGHNLRATVKAENGSGLASSSTLLSDPVKPAVNTAIKLDGAVTLAEVVGYLEELESPELLSITFVDGDFGLFAGGSTNPGERLEELEESPGEEIENAAVEVIVLAGAVEEESPSAKLFWGLSQHIKDLLQVPSNGNEEAPPPPKEKEEEGETEEEEQEREEEYEQAEKEREKPHRMSGKQSSTPR